MFIFSNIAIAQVLHLRPQSRSIEPGSLTPKNGHSKFPHSLEACFPTYPCEFSRDSQG